MWTCSSITVQQTDFSHTECEYFKYIKFIVSTHTNSTVWRLVWVWECVLACMSGSQEKPNEPKCKKSEKNARKTIIITVTHKYTFLYGISTRKKNRKKAPDLTHFLPGFSTSTIAAVCCFLPHSLTLCYGRINKEGEKITNVEMKEDDFT